MENLVVLDCEVYPNYILVAFKSLDNNRIVTIEIKGENSIISADKKNKLYKILYKYTTFGFNSNNYDMFIINYIFKDKTVKEINDLSQEIITGKQHAWQIAKTKNLYKNPDFKHFDISEPAPGVKVSLKLYGGRLNSKKLQDLPIAPNSFLTELEMEQTKKYCVNDLNTTIDLFNSIKERMQLRYEMSKEYGFEIMSKSDAQIAEMVIKQDMYKLTSKNFNRPVISEKQQYKYIVPDYIKFKTEQLQDVLETIKNCNFAINDKGSIVLPGVIKNRQIKIGSTKYQMGVGGLHSKEKCRKYKATDEHYVIDKDVTSYYPSIILNLNLYPKHLGPSFLKIYKNILDKRLKAKKEGNKVLNESLKIVVNGSFGKFGNKWSVLYSPDLMMQVTLTGQLSLLMLIERLELNNIKVVSANTDGFVAIVPKEKYNLYDTICFDWELNTNFTLEETRYKTLFSRDVNNYLAVSENGKIKGKGIFNFDPLSKNPDAPICLLAAIEKLVNNISIEKTIKECKDLTKFLTIRSVTGGAQWRENYLGRVVRWIYSTNGDTIYYCKPNKKGVYNKVAKSENSRPIMELGIAFPEDIDYDRYIYESNEIINDIGFLKIY